MKIKRVKYKEIENFPEFNLNQKFSENFQGSSPAPFVGRFGYPYVNIGVLSPQFLETTGIHDSPKEWSTQNFSINKIAGLRCQLVNSRQKTKVLVGEEKNNKLLEICQEIGMASKPAELEINLKNIPKLNLIKENEIIPFGPTGELKKIRITENTKIDSRVDKLVSDTDLKAFQGVLELYKKGFDTNFLSKLLSVGNLGLKKNRRLVPTRWSITATDDSIGKELITEIKQFSVGDYRAYFGGGWGNYYLVLFFPEIWSYELFEVYLDKKINPWSKNSYAYSTDYEDYSGRKTYAEECAGGYYAARISVLEKLKENHKQNSILVLRFVSPEYNIPLGVWICREAARKSLQEKPLEFNSKESMLKYCQESIKNRLGFDIDLLLKESRLLNEMNIQKRLADF